MALAGFASAGTALASTSKPGPTGETTQTDITLGIDNESWCLSVLDTSLHRAGSPHVYLLPCSYEGAHNKWIIVKTRNVAEIELLAKPDLCLSLNDGSSGTDAVLQECSSVNANGFPVDLDEQDNGLWVIAYLGKGNTLSVTNVNRKVRGNRQVFWASQSRSGEYNQLWRISGKWERVTV